VSVLRWAIDPDISERSRSPRRVYVTEYRRRGVYPGVLRKNVQRKGLHNLVVRKCMKTKGRSFCVWCNDRRCGSSAKNPIHTK
jgi:hypothetical protein